MQRSNHDHRPDFRRDHLQLTQTDCCKTTYRSRFSHYKTDFEIAAGSNFEISIRDTAKLISEIMGTNLEILSNEERIRPDNSEVERLWADNSKAKEIFGWEPKYKGLEGFKDGLTKTINWFSQGENLSNYKSEIYNL